MVRENRWHNKKYHMLKIRGKFAKLKKRKKTIFIGKNNFTFFFSAEVGLTFGISI